MADTTAAQSGSRQARLAADLAAARTRAADAHPGTDAPASAMRWAIEAGHLLGAAECLAREADRLEAESKPRKLFEPTCLCASTLEGVPVAIEYETSSDNNQLYIVLEAVHIGGKAIPITHYEAGNERGFSRHQIDAWTLDCERAEGWHNGDSGDVDEPFDCWRDRVADALAAEDKYIAQIDHQHYARAA